MHYSTAFSMILSHYGIETQKRKLQEECAELIRAIAREDEDNILEEMADVLILIEQFLTNVEYFEKIENIKNSKIERTLKRINDKMKNYVIPNFSRATDRQ